MISSFLTIPPSLPLPQKVDGSPQPRDRSSGDVDCKTSIYPTPFQVFKMFKNPRSRNPPKAHSSSLRTGGAKNPSFAALADSDDDAASSNAVISVSAYPVCSVSLLDDSDPIYAAMRRGDMLWGDLLIPSAAVAVYTPPPVDDSRPVYGEEDFWSQTWSASVDCHWSDCYDTSAMSAADWEAMMTWLYAVGWDIAHESRKYVRAFPDNQPARVWVAPSRFALLAQSDDSSHPVHHHHSNSCSHSSKSVVQLSAPGSDKGKRKGVPIPRFCKAAAACTEEGCRYTHGDTIPRVNQVCSFGASCGSSDPTGVKRSQCLHMHPGETWAEGMVITRPAPSN